MKKRTLVCALSLAFFAVTAASCTKSEEAPAPAAEEAAEVAPKAAAPAEKPMEAPAPAEPAPQEGSPET